MPSAVARAAEQRADAAERSKDTSRAEATLLREQLSHVTERAQEHEAAAHQKAHEQLQYYICEHKGAQRHAEHLHAVQRSEHLKAAQHNEELMAALFCEELQAARCDADTMAAAKHRKEASDLRHKLTACCEEVTAFRAEAACMSDERRRILLEVRGLKEVELPQLRAGADERDRVAAELRRVQGVEVPCLLRDSRERERELLAEVATSKSQANTVEHELSRLRSEFDSLKEIHVVKLQEEVTQARSEAASVQQQCNQNKGELHTLTNFELPKWKSQAKEKEHLEVRLRNAHEVDIPNLKRMAGERESELWAEIASAREEAAQSVDEKSKLALELVNLKSVELPRLQRSVEENGRLARGIQGTRQGELDKLRLELHAKGLALQKTEAQLQTLNSQWSERYSCLNDALEAAGKQLSRLEVASAPGCCEAAAMSASLPHGASQFMGTVLGHLSAGAGNVDHVGPSTMSDTADDDLVQWALAQTGSNFSGLEDLRGAGPAGMSPTSSCIASFTGKASMPSPAASTHCREASPVGGALRHSSSLPISTSAGIEAVGRKAYSAHRDRGRTVQQRAVGKARPVQRLRG